MTGASRFPRHWVYDAEGALSHKSGLTDFKDWYRKSFGRHTPWGDEDSEALVTAVETALERTLSEQVMHGGGKPTIRRLKAGDDAGRARASRAPRSSCCSTGCCGWSTTASGWPSTGRARCWASARTWRAARGPRRCVAVTAVPGRRRSTPTSSTARRCRSCRRASPRRRRAEPERLARASTSAASAARPRRRALSSCATAGTPRAWPSPHDGDGRPTLILDAGTGLRQVTPAARRRSRSAARSCSPTCTGTTSRDCRSSPPATATTRGSACCCPSRRTARARSRCWPRAMSPPHFPIAPERAARRLDVRHRRAGRRSSRGLHGAGAGDPAQGRATFGYRVSDGQRRSPTCPTTAPPRSAPGPTGWGEYHAGRARARQRTPTCSCTTRSLLARGARRRSVVRPRRGRLRHRARPAGRGARGSCSSTTARTAPTMRSTSWPRRWSPEAPAVAVAGEGDGAVAACRPQVQRRRRQTRLDADRRRLRAERARRRADPRARRPRGATSSRARPTPGGGCRTEELTLPGFSHDVCSAVHPLLAASPFFARHRPGCPRGHGC